ncbi:MAG TPA: septal ring lytic transglycosylase RlpA family protein [Verrucomicrobiales bacterium]|nr:septal ring lytic transglycosylase RlpA family protein [Verrucomicrobiales bacterium]
MKRRACFSLLLTGILVGCSQVEEVATAAPAPASMSPRVRSVQMGKASWYSIRCNGGTQTASGERLRDMAMTAAHKSLPMGTKVRVTNERNGKSVIVRINDRGPYIRGRIIDVTKGAALKLEMVKSGVAPVKVEVLEPAET